MQGRVDDVAQAVVAEALVGDDEDVGALAAGDRGGQLAAEALVGDGQQLDAVAAESREVFDDRGQGGPM